MVVLSEASLEFARKHLTHYSDSDFFPKPFDYYAIWDNWPDAKAHLLSKPVENLPVRPPRTLAAPKPNGTYRVVHQLEPLDAIVYTAMTYMVASSIETNRAPPLDRVACSYRLSLSGKDGNFFVAGSGYQEFLDQSRKLALAHNYVLLTDITDFYNQIYTHRVQNAISLADPNLNAVHFRSFSVTDRVFEPRARNFLAPRLTGRLPRFRA